MSTRPEEMSWQKVPGGIEVEPAGNGAVYRWRVLPDSPGLVVFYAALALLVLALGVLGIFLLFGAVSDWIGILKKQFKDYGDFEIVVIGIVLIVLLVKTWNFFAIILFARCRLALSPEEFDYEVFLFGCKVRSKSYHLPASDVVSLALKDVSSKGLEVQRPRGAPFYLLLQRFSEADLMKIKKRFFQDLGREKP